MITTAQSGGFDAASYWDERLSSDPELTATGTRPFGVDYQRYLYRLKERAVKRVLRPWWGRIAGAKVLNVGCGHGYFEPVFASWGAAEVVGADFVPGAIEALRQRQTQFEYHVVDITQPLPDELAGRTFDLVTAMDVLYHIVDEDRFARAMDNLVSLCRPGNGLLLWTDAPGCAADTSLDHIRHRDWSAYNAALGKWDMRLQRSTPMYHLYDIYTRWSDRLARHPRLSYPAMFAVDILLAPWGLRRSTNHCAISVRG